MNNKGEKPKITRKSKERKYLEKRNIEEIFLDVTRNLPGIILETDIKGSITFINKKGIEMLGYTVEELEEKTIWQLVAIPGRPVDENEAQKFLFRSEDGSQEYNLIRKDQSFLPVECHSSAIKNEKGKTIGFQCLLLDITPRKEYEEKIKYLSFHDKLTGLYNRAYFEEELVKLDSNRNLPLSIVMGDVNNLKMINDTFGHQHGDHLLSRIAEVLKSCFRRSDVISRWGGDEFSAILPYTTRETGIGIINRIKKECQRRSTLTLPLSISFGIATKENSSENINAIVSEAESRMYRYKIFDRRASDSALIVSMKKALQQKKYDTEEYRQSYIDCATKFGETLKLEKTELNKLKLLSAICDIGKIAVSEDIILKKGWLSKEEWEEIKRHPEIGFRIARTSPELSNIANDILYHHEFWNGNGYPHKLKGEDIPLLSRIIHIVDAYQAMTNERPYRGAMSKEEAIEQLRSRRGSQFDPILTDKFINMVASS
ncbi:MAG: diguanylate cyclase [Candidatus Caldatribacteriota bacterium]|jgi:diguanylate cyclase (GGDEF)-like protein/PAS domain S-box-containing protein|nr:diguanylate cyclase [Atribacterota bacterium]